MTSAAAGRYFVAAMGFAAMARGRRAADAAHPSLRPLDWDGGASRRALLPHNLPRLIQGTSEDSVFGYGFLRGILALAIWSIATSFAAYRAVATDARC